MKIRIKKQELLKALGKLVSISSSNKLMPILNNVLIEALPENKIKFTVNSLDMSMITYIQAIESTIGSYTLPCQQLYQIVNTFNEEVNIDVNDDNAVLITEGKSKLKIKGMESSNFPQLPEINGYKFDLLAKIINDGLTNASIAVRDVGYDDILSGINLIIKDNKIEFCGLDENRMSIYTCPIDFSKEISMVIPNKAAIEVLKNIKNQPCIELEVSQSIIKFNLGEDVIYTNLISGTFPHYQQVIPKEFKNIIRFNVNDFLLAVKKIETIADRDYSTIDINFKNNEIMLYYKSKEGLEFNEIISCEYNGEFNVNTMVSSMYL
jgi:DNA polymerase III subunit beta